MAWKRRIVLVAATVLGGIVGLAVALMTPNEYRSTARLLAPQTSSSLFGALSRNFSSAARLLGDNAGGDYARHLTILTSPAVLQAAVDSFQLVRVYELQDKEFPDEAARKELSERASFEIDEVLEYLSISVLDQDRARAAAMANFFVRELNRRERMLTRTSSVEYSGALEERYISAMNSLDSVLDATKQFQQRYGVFDLPAQSQAYFEQLGALRAQEIRLQAEYNALNAQLGPDHPDVQSAQSALQSARSAYQSAVSGRERALPVPQGALPEMARQYASLEQERTMQVTILEAIAPLYEAARLETQRPTTAVQVIDAARPAGRKAAPKRSLIVLGMALSAFMLTLVYLVAADVWRRAVPRLHHELNRDL